MGTQGKRAVSTASPLDFDHEWQRAATEAGDSRVVSRSVVRTIYTGGDGSGKGSGTADVVRLDDDALVDIVNCVMPRMARWTYTTDEPLIMLRASLACDVQFRFGDKAPLVFNRPEVTLACMPKGLPMTVDIAGGARQQGIVEARNAATMPCWRAPPAMSTVIGRPLGDRKSVV